MICEFCNGQTAPKKVKKHHWLNGKLYIVENVLVEVCQECGERYYHAKTLDAIDDYLTENPLPSVPMRYVLNTIERIVVGDEAVEIFGVCSPFVRSKREEPGEPDTRSSG